MHLVADIERLIVDVMLEHNCHTAILYGSWARGEANAQSDVDVLYVRETGSAFRDARMVEGVYLDAFIYPEADLAALDPQLLRALGGRVVRETNGFGSALLAKLQELHAAGPAPLADDLRQVSVLWSHKMLDRFRGQSSLEARYRRMQLVLQSLDDYFALRGSWFRGPKEGFAWLQQHDTATHHLFEKATEPHADDAAFAALVEAVYGPFERGSDPRGLKAEADKSPSPQAVAICAAQNVTPCPPAADLKVGIALDTLHLDPLNGLRSKAEHGTCGWYIWGGQDLPDDPDFFAPLHVSHLSEQCPRVVPYLALPPGWRFLLGANEHIDVWYDPTLVEE